MDRENKIKLLGLNLGVASANIIVLPEVLVGGNALATAFGIAFIFLSGAGLIYGNMLNRILCHAVL
jgi:hypothetical protein